jgi:hypothetical protein
MTSDLNDLIITFPSCGCQKAGERCLQNRKFSPNFNETTQHFLKKMITSVWTFVPKESNKNIDYVEGFSKKKKWDWKFGMSFPNFFLNSQIYNRIGFFLITIFLVEKTTKFVEKRYHWSCPC